jgi:hypothetical protein
MNVSQAAKLEMLRHTIATLAYRAGKPLRNAPNGFADFTAPGIVKTPVKILVHISSLIDWTLCMAHGEGKPHDETPLPWNQEVARLYRNLEALDAYLASDQALHEPVEKLFQGPIADALTHVGQLSLLRRMAEAPVKGENYFVADIAVGRVGSEQAPAKIEF